MKQGQRPTIRITMEPSVALPVVIFSKDATKKTAFYTLLCAKTTASVTLEAWPPDLIVGCADTIAA